MSELEELHESVEVLDIGTVQMSGTEKNSQVFNESFLKEEVSLSDEEREEILKDIEDVVSENRIRITKDLFEIHPVKRGFVLPVMNFLFMAGLVAAVILFSTRYFESEKAELNIQTSGYLSTEGQLLEELRRSSEEALASKEQEISDIQTQLQQLDAESQSLRENIESTIQEREDELRRQLEAELEAERRKLQAEGRSVEYIERELESIEAQKTDQITAELDAFKAQAAESIREKEEELARAKRVTEDILRQANEEKARIVEETQAREEELTAQFEEERQALIAQSSEASARLEEIARQQENENLITDQIIAGYNTVIRNMQSENYSGATAAIAQIRGILNDPKIENLPRISKRKPVETFILDTLEEEIQLEETAPEDTPAAMIQAAEQLFRARGLVSRAETAEAGGDTETAQRLYSEAVSTVPALEKAVNNLRSIESERRNIIASGYIAEGGRFMNTGNISAAARQFEEAAAAFARSPRETEQISGIFSTYSTGIQENTAQTSAELSARLAEQEAAYNELQEKYAGDIAALEEQLASAAGKVDAARLEEAVAQIQTLEGALSVAESRTAELTQLLNEANEKVSALEAAAESAAKIIEEPEEAADVASEGTAEVPAELLEKYEAQETLIAQLNAEIESLTEERIIKEQEAETYRSEIETLENRIAAIEAQSEESGTAVSLQIMEKQEEIESLSQKLEAAEGNVKGLKESLQTASANLTSLRNELQNEKNAAAAQKQRLEEEISVLEGEKEQLQADLDAAVLELVNFVTSREGDERYASLALLYNEYRLRIESLISSSDYSGADSLMTRFFNESSVAEIFPGIAEITTEISEYITEREKEEGITAGRRSALSDVLTAADYLSNDPRRNMEETPLENVIRTEPRFEEAVKAIQELAVQNLKQRVSSQSRQGVFIGSISAIDGERVIIESLSLDEIPPGTGIVVKRFTSSGDAVIARGEVVSQQGSRVIAVITEPTSTPPRSVDLVYTEDRD